MSVSSTVRIWIDPRFMYLQSYPVSNHGISEEIIAATLESTKAYFSLPLETKMEARILLSRSFMISL
jgi:isopenicillin N synthase-like dioxygenase